MPDHATSLDDLPDMTALLSRSGLDFMRDMIAGTLPGPPIGATLGFHPVVAEPGCVVFEGTPSFAALNPMRGVHGGWYGAILDSCMGCAVMTELARRDLHDAGIQDQHHPRPTHGPRGPRHRNRATSRPLNGRRHRRIARRRGWQALRHRLHHLHHPAARRRPRSHPASTAPGFMIPCGSSAALMLRIASSFTGSP